MLTPLPNQFTKAEGEGKEKPAGANQFTTGKRAKHDQATIDKIRAERAAQVTEEIMEQPDATPEQRLAAAKILLPFGKSTLQSIESRDVNDFENMSEDEMLAMVNALITSNPGLIAKLGIGLRPVEAAPTDSNTVTDTQQKAG